MSTSSRVIKNTIFLYIRMAVSILVNVFTTRILLEALGASDYGLYNVVGSAVAMLGFVTASMSSSTQRFISYAEGEGSRERIREVFANALVVHWALAACAVILFLAAAFILFNGVLNIPEGREGAAMWVYGFMIFSTVFSITVVPYDALLNARENMFVYSVVGIADVLFKLGIAVAVAFHDAERLVFYGALMAAESWLVRFITQWYCRRRYGECRGVRPCGAFRGVLVRKMLSFAGCNMMNIATGMISLFSMGLILNHFFGTVLNAALGVATQLSGVLMAVSMNMIKALTPVLVKKEAARQRSQMLDISYLGCKFSFLLFSFFCVPVVLFIHPILELWLRDVPERTAVFCQVLIAGTLVDQLTVFLHQSLSAQGDIGRYSAARSVVNIMPVTASVLMFSCGEFSPVWIVLNWVLWKMFAGGLVNLYYARRQIGLSLRAYAGRVLAPCLLVLAAVVTAGMALGRGAHGLPGVFCPVLLAFASIPLYWFLSLTRRERGMLLSFANNTMNFK